MTVSESPFARIVSPAEVTAAGVRVHFEADDAQRAALAKIADVVAVDAFRAELEVKQIGRAHV